MDIDFQTVIAGISAGAAVIGTVVAVADYRSRRRRPPSSSRPRKRTPRKRV